MPTIDLGATPASPEPAGLLASLPRRLTLTLPELRLAAELTDGAPLPFEVGAPRAGVLDSRLGRSTGEDEAAYAAALAALPEPDAALSRRGLLRGDALDEGLRGAIGLLATPTVAVDLDVSAGRGRAKAWHRQAGGAVATLATADGIVFELAWFPVERWGEELARAAVLPEEVVVARSVVPDGLDLPYELLDAAAEAARSGRGDLLSVLAVEHAAGCRGADGAPIPELELLGVLQGLTSECRGRLRALVADVSGESTDVAGVVSWLLLADGWRSLRPRHVGSVGHVTVTRVASPDLALALAPVLAEVAR
ncbi:hypothetical protein [Nocardioides sp. YIM 152315]|uniref:hypothetical protein n=1 Tax=Nocardioides sp. YIM 152315 TaxID=3031760 RepID=UPI0023DAA653|nr:hypothetical protein [Nocardioides sp. YIM 152315]MDF1605263.1 hypothetical protein [Nocardioides sp. YIM 152315]